jgi:hypothetical protein
MKIWPEFADENTIKFRRSNCDICEKAKLGICKQCGCVIDFKIRLKSEACPLGKWPSQKIEWPNSA